MRKPPLSSVFLFEEGPKFRAWDRGELILEVDPKRSKAHKLAYHVLFVLYGLPAKIIYRGPGMSPKDVDHLEYYPVPKDLMFVRNLRRLLPNLSMDKLVALIKSFYEDKMERVEEYLEAWGLISSLSNHSFTQNLKVVVA